MDASSNEPITGDVLTLGDRECAMYQRGGRLWVAEFDRDGHCTIVEATKWLRPGYQAIAKARRNHTLKAPVPISAELAETIACLHFIYVDDRVAA